MVLGKAAFERNYGKTNPAASGRAKGQSLDGDYPQLAFTTWAWFI